MPIRILRALFRWKKIFMAASSITGAPLVRDPVRDSQVLWLTVATTVLFAAGMGYLGYYYVAMHDASVEAPFSSGWGVILVTMGGLLRELTARGLQ
jgi:hypothetical protein